MCSNLLQGIPYLIVCINVYKCKRAIMTSQHKIVCCTSLVGHYVLTEPGVPHLVSLMFVLGRRRKSKCYCILNLGPKRTRPLVFESIDPCELAAGLVAKLMQTRTFCLARLILREP